MEVILMIGIQGSGKTWLTLNEFPHHAHISLDIIKKFPPDKKAALLAEYTESNVSPLYEQNLSKGRRIEHVMIDRCLKDGKNIVVDDTNITREIRKRHIRLAQKYGVTVNGIFFQNIQKAYEQNKNRKESLDKKILDSFHRDLEIPHIDEGFGHLRIEY